MNLLLQRTKSTGSLLLHAKITTTIFIRVFSLDSFNTGDRTPAHLFVLHSVQTNRNLIPVHYPYYD